MTKWVYKAEEGDAGMKDLLGGKGANLCQMTKLGIPVPPVFTVTTEACNAYLAAEGKFPEGLDKQIAEGIVYLQGKMSKDFGDDRNPLLVSVRSGAKFSMPGMMETVLNLGLNDKAVESLAKQSGNPRFAYDCYRRFISMFSDVVLSVEHDLFEQALKTMRNQKGVKADNELTTEDLKKLVGIYKGIVKEHYGEFPQDPRTQLKMAIEAVFKSWNIPRAKTYRKQYHIPETLGTAVNVQCMVFGNFGDNSATGVAFTRNPSDGAPGVYGEYLINAQGEDVVAGIRTPLKIAEMQSHMPELYKQFMDICVRLEDFYKDMQDIELTIQEGVLYILQTRNGKRTGRAAVRIAVDMVNEGLIDRRKALMQVDPSSLNQLLHPTIDPKARYEVLAKGLNASPGAASGPVVFTPAKAVEAAQSEHPAILVRVQTTPDDIHGMIAAAGVLTSQGGMTSHAAVVARGMGKPCIAGCGAIDVHVADGYFAVGDKKFKEGDVITIDGTTGEVIAGKVPLIEAKVSDEFAVLLKWADEVRRLKVRTNADDGPSAQKARMYGAEGIGLARTEHMFMGDRAELVAELILMLAGKDRSVPDVANRINELLIALGKLQKGDFIDIFRAMDGLPVTIRLIDPPLHEFIPSPEKIAERIKRLEAEGGKESEIANMRTLDELKGRLHEDNPMLGLRGCRLGILYPEINRMQVKAILEAALDVEAEGKRVLPEIMIPLSSHKNELIVLKELVNEVAEEVFRKAGKRIAFMYGTMIEIPRAALTAADIAEQAEFFSFGTNDLSQMCYGISRDDAEKHFLKFYVDKGILPRNPFQVLDEDGVGRLMRLAIEGGRKTRPNIKLGICGEHGGDPESIDLCHRLGLNYVSCSPFRVPVARLAAAQAAIKHG